MSLQASEIVVEVRDVTLQRRAAIMTRDLKLTAVVRDSAIGEWKLSLYPEHPAVPILATPGSGIVVSTRVADVDGAPRFETLFSGPTDQPSRQTSRQVPSGMYTFTGLTDDVLLADASAWPEPSNPDPATQAETNDVRSGAAETIMRAYVSANIGPAAPPSRRGLLAQKLTLAADGGRGPTVSRSPRWQNLGELLGGIAKLADLGFRIVQVDDTLEFQVYEHTDRTGEVRFDVKNGTLESEESRTSPPTVTRTLVLGQGVGTERAVSYRTSSAAELAEGVWGRVVEQVIDARQTADPLELDQAGDEKLAEGGFTAVAVKALPSDDITMRFRVDWNVGDRVGIVMDGAVSESNVTAAAIIADESGVKVGAAIGDLSTFDPEAAKARRVDNTERRVAKLEAEAENGGPVNWGTLEGVPSTFPPDAHGHPWEEVSGKPSEFPPTAHSHPTLEAGLSALEVGLRILPPIHYTSSGTFSKAAYVAMGCTHAIVEVQGGGGAGGGRGSGLASGGGAGGGGGGYAKKVVPLSSFSTDEPVTVGGGGPNGTGDGGTGGTSSCAGVIGYGGAGGGNSNSGALGGIGGGGVGDLVVHGSPGGPTFTVSGSFTYLGGGGGSHLGAGGRQRQNFQQTGWGYAGEKYGGGGSGCHRISGQASQQGGDGAAGIVIITPLLGGAS